MIGIDADSRLVKETRISADSLLWDNGASFRNRMTVEDAFTTRHAIASCVRVIRDYGYTGETQPLVAA